MSSGASEKSSSSPKRKKTATPQSKKNEDRPFGVGIVEDKDTKLIALPFEHDLVLMGSDAALSLAFELVMRAEEIDPLAKAKMRGIFFAEEMKGKMHLLDDWKKIPGYQQVADAFRSRDGHFNNDLEVLNFFISPNMDVGPCEPIPDNSKCRSPIQALKDGDIDACMHAVENWMK